jgi:hypothetical protein
LRIAIIVATGLAWPWVAAGQHLMKDDAEREEVAPRIEDVALDLFGRHIGECSDNLPGPTEFTIRRPLTTIAT